MTDDKKPDDLGPAMINMADKIAALVTDLGPKIAEAMERASADAGEPQLGLEAAIGHREIMARVLELTAHLNATKPGWLDGAWENVWNTPLAAIGLGVAYSRLAGLSPDLVLMACVALLKSFGAPIAGVGFVNTADGAPMSEQDITARANRIFRGERYGDATDPTAATKTADDQQQRAVEDLMAGVWPDDMKVH